MNNRCRRSSCRAVTRTWDDRYRSWDKLSGGADDRCGGNQKLTVRDRVEDGAVDNDISVLCGCHDNDLRRRRLPRRPSTAVCPC